MADANTTRYGFVKPEVGASADTWGAKLNTDFDDIDAIAGAITTTGSANAYVLTTGLSLAAYVAGQTFWIKANFSNTGAATINVDTLGAKDLRKNGTTALASGDIVSGNIYAISYDGTLFQVIGPVTTQYEPKDATLTALAALSYTSGTLYLTMTAADTFALADDATLVKTTGTQTVGGAKTFSSLLTGSADVRATDGAGSARLYAVGDIQAYRTGGTAGYIFFNAGYSNYLGHDATNYVAGGTVIALAGKQAVPVVASAMVANTTNGAAAGVTESTTNKVMLRTLDFDQTTQEGAQFLIPMPKSWNESTVTFQPIWTAASGSGGVVWELRAVALSDDDAFDAAFGTGQTSTDTLIATGDVHIGPESSAITIAGTPAEGDLVVFQIRRNVSDGSDTLNADAKLIGIRLYITTNAKNDT